jgi:hypothetical protein
MFRKLISLFLVFIASIQTIFASFLTDRLSDIGVGLGDLLKNPVTVGMFMFFALFFGIYSLFNVLLKFAFKDHALDGENKARKVVAFMMSFIGVTGLYYFFTIGGATVKNFVLTFGGFFGFLIVLVLSFFVFKLFQNFAEALTKDNQKGAKLGYALMMTLGSLTVLYLIFGFTGQVLKAYDCDVTSPEIKNTTEEGFLKTKICPQSTFYGTLMYWTINLISLAATLLFIFGPWYWFARNKKDEGDGDDDGSTESKDEQSKEAKSLNTSLGIVKKELGNLNENHKERSKVLKGMLAEVKNAQNTSGSVDSKSASDIANQREDK